MNYGMAVLVISTTFGIYVGILMQRPVSSLANSMKCPFCYGNDLCDEIEDRRITLRYKSFTEFFYNLFSVKNVYFADFDSRKVVLKKLGSNMELKTVGDSVVNNFKPCRNVDLERFMKAVGKKFALEQVQTILQINVEPLILSLLGDGSWPVPKLYGRCGSLIVEEYNGIPLNDLQFASWQTRAFLTLQLLQAAIDFTHKHHEFRLYLTDISPDNIAVDGNSALHFVDLENVILKQKDDNNQTYHYSQYFTDDEFVYNEEEVCQSSISDHNVYAVCRLLLSQRAPWPMMPNGLLHSPPPQIKETYKELFHLVETCVYSENRENRFNVAEKLIEMLGEFVKRE